MPRMRRMLIGAVLTLWCSAACSGAAPLSEDARIAREADALVVSMARAYESKDLSGVMAGLAARLSDRQEIEQATRQAFDRFDRIELAISVDRIHLEGREVTVFAHWDGRWREANRVPIVRQGTVRLVMAAGTPVLVVQITGHNPFGLVPGPAIS